MSTPPPDTGPASTTPTDRGRAEQLYAMVCRQSLADLKAADDPHPDTQLLMLQAIYHELRHGHDQAARRAAALAEQVRALDEHADAMDKLRGSLADHADALSRYRSHL